MRDPDRIDEIVELLRLAWHRTPDQRLGQLILNATRDSSGKIISPTGLWNTGDWVFEDEFKRQSNYELYSKD